LYKILQFSVKTHHTLNQRVHLTCNEHKRNHAEIQTVHEQLRGAKYTNIKKNNAFNWSKTN